MRSSLHARLTWFALPLIALAACDPGEVPRGDGSTDAHDAHASDTAPIDTAPPTDVATDTGAPIDAADDASAIDVLDAPTDSPTPDDVPTAPDVRDVLEPDVPAGTTTIDLHDVTLFDNPADLADWPVTTMITRVDFQPGGRDGVHVEFSLRDGTGSWPDVTPPGWDGPLQYTLGFVEYIDGHWYGSAAIQFWRGLDSSGGNVALDVPTNMQCTAFGHDSTCQVAQNWYYDGRWGALQHYQPATGEIIGVFVVAGNVRGVTDGSQSPARERSNVVLVHMPDATGGTFTF